MFHHLNVSLPELSTKTINRKRFYITSKGNHYPSITTVLSIRKKEGLLEWRKRVGDKVANYVAGKAAARGTKVHHMCEDYLNNQHIDWPNKWKEHSKDFLPWCKNSIIISNIDNISKIQFAPIIFDSCI